MLFYLLLCVLLFPCAYGGSKCPPRSNIYPCICIDRSIGKSKFDTTLVCRGFDDGNSLLSIEDSLANMDIDRFLLYDSYWSNGLRVSQANAEVAINILSSFRIEEIKIVDTNMKSFACPQDYNCRTSYVKRFTAINSTLPDKSPCGNNGFSINYWISCPEIVEEIRIENGFGSDVTLRPSFFPAPMPKLKELYLRNNHISKIDRRTFSLLTFPSLLTLDLSHNSLKDIKNIFSTMLKLKHLDLSYNALRYITDFQYLPHLQSLKLTNNQITALTSNEWQHIPENLRLVDVTNNDLTCDCSFGFVNSTFHVNAILLGECKRPTQVKGKKLRKAARFLIARCNEAGEIGTKHSTHVHHAQ